MKLEKDRPNLGVHLDTLKMPRQEYEGHTDDEDFEEIESVVSSETDDTEEEVRIRVLESRKLDD